MITQEKTIEEEQKKMTAEESFNYLYVTLPAQVSGSNLEMINILTPILNVDDNGKNHHHHQNENSNNGLTTANHHRLSSNDIVHNDHHHHSITFETIDIKSENGILTINTDESQTSPSDVAISIDPDLDLKRYERLQKDIMRKKMARMRETEQQRLQRLQKDRERKKLSRQNETYEQRQRRLEKDRIRIQQRRALESDEERKRRLEKNRLSKRNARIKENPRYNS